MTSKKNPMSGSDDRAKNGASAVYLPLGIVFLVVATVMLILGTTAFIAFFAMGATFLIIGLLRPSEKDEDSPTK